MARELVTDVEHWAECVNERVEGRVRELYPKGADGNEIIGYIWARTIPCANPSCRSEIPMLRSLLICDLRNGSKRVALNPVLDRKHKTVGFKIVKDKDIRDCEGTMIRGGDCRCPFCKQITSVEEVRRSAQAGKMGEKIVAVIIDRLDRKDYRSVEQTDISAYAQAKAQQVSEKPTEVMPHFRNINLDLYGFRTWADIFNDRQLAVVQAFVDETRRVMLAIKKAVTDKDYADAISVYMVLMLGRYLQRMSNMGVWHTGQETFEHPFGRQAIPMVWDYPEANPFSAFAKNVFSPKYMLAVIKRESAAAANGCFATTTCGDAASVPKLPTRVDLVITDPPYFDAIAYADISDYFYVWFKRIIGELLPSIFSTPTTPKAEEATALPHRHGNDDAVADKHFQDKLTQALKRSHDLVGQNGRVVVMFAHQSTHAWTALINSVFKAGLTINSTWPVDTEKTYALKTTQSVLASSITVTCAPRHSGPAASLKEIRKEIQKVVRDSVHRFWDYGFRGADLIVACYGPAVGVFGRHQRVERADGTPVDVPNLARNRPRVRIESNCGRV